MSALGQLASAPGRRVSASKGYCKKNPHRVLDRAHHCLARGAHTRLLPKWWQTSQRADCRDNNNLVGIDILIFSLDSRQL
jgi:hypothetical protein